MVLSLCAAAPAAAEDALDAPAADLTDLSIDQLMNLEVVTASKFAQRTSEAPAAVTVITAADIKDYGYRTLAEALTSVRGMYVSYDRYYHYLGVRGFGRTGDYNSRVLLLVDGYRTNDPLYDSALIGPEFPLDLDLIDRIEVVSGPGSSIYGSNAAFAVINVITKTPDQDNGLQVSADYGSFGTDSERLTYSKRWDSGLGVMLSASRANSDGQDLFFREFDAPETNNGVAHNLDWQKSYRLYGKLDYGGFTLSALHAWWEKAIPTGAWGMLFNDPQAHWIDDNTFLNLQYQRPIGARWSVSGRVFYGRYVGQGYYPYEDVSVILNRDEAYADWWGAELTLNGRFKNHKLIAGGEFQDNFRQDQLNYDRDLAAQYLDDRRTSTRMAAYVQDEVTIFKTLLLNAGVRYDRYSNIGGTLNPRLALIWSARPDTTLKALYGTAFRAPNAYELFYNDGGVTSKANALLKPETSRSYEFVVEHSLRPNFRVVVDAYYNEYKDLIDQVVDPSDELLIYQNLGGVISKGVEVEVERLWSTGARLRASYAWQTTKAKGAGEDVVNSPRSLAKVSLSAPILNDRARVGAQLQYMSRRKTLAGASADAHWIADLTVTTRLPGRDWELSGGLYNLFDERYSDPGGPEHLQDQIPQDGRTFRVKLAKRF
jgi:iron complex outermembrane receptor protein